MVKGTVREWRRCGKVSVGLSTARGGKRLGKFGDVGSAGWVPPEAGGQV